jgi:hypothetical protein
MRGPTGLNELTAKEYAAQRGIHERQVIKDITNDVLPGYQSRGIWYVRIVTEQPPIAPHAPFVSVLDYSQQTGIPVSRILEEIASGARSGFHEQGVWYLGNKVKANPPRRHRRMAIQVALIILVITIAIAVWLMPFHSIHHGDLALLTIDTQLVDKSGGSRPIINEKFFLLDSGLDTIANSYIKELSIYPHTAKNADITSDNSWSILLSGSAALRSLLFDISYRSNSINKWEFAANFTKSKWLWDAHIVQMVITDANGKAEFKPIQAKNYWVIGWTETNAGFGFWNYKILLQKGNNHLVLNQKNAVYYK